MVDSSKVPRTIYDIVPIPLYIPKPQSVTKKQDAVRVATPDLFLPLSKDNVDVDSMTDLVFQGIGGQEILNVMNAEITGDVDVEVLPVKDLRDMFLTTDAAQMSGFYDYSTSYFNSFPINLDDYVVPDQIMVNNGFVITTPQIGNQQKITVVNAIGDGTNVTYELGANHGLTAGDRVQIFNINPNGYNYTFPYGSGGIVLSTPTLNKFVVANTTTDEYLQSNVIYIDPNTGDLVIELLPIPSNVRVEVEILSAEEYLNTERTL